MPDDAAEQSPTDPPRSTVALMPHRWCSLARFVGPSSDCAEGDRRGKLVGSTSVGLAAAPSDRSHRLDATAGPPRAQSMGASRGR